MRSSVVGPAHPWYRILSGISLILIPYLAYRPFLGNFFTAADTLTLIETSRVESLSDIARLFASPLMGDTGFLHFARFYRPISALSFSLDYHLWELNPFGYHLTNLFLHLSVSVAVYFLMWNLVKKRTAAWLTSLLFAIHPIIVESVPAISRRQDIIATLFVVLSLLTLLKSDFGVKRGDRYFWCSVPLYALALGAKEIAAILPLLVFSYVALQISAQPRFFPDRLIEAARRSFPFFFVSALFILWRSYVLVGFGGYTSNRPGFNLRDSLGIAKDYFFNLFAPVPVGFLPVQLLAALALGLYAAQVIVSRRTPRGETEKLGMAVKIPRVLLAWTTPVLLLAVALNPLLVGSAAPFIESAHRGEGVGVLVSAMGGRDSHPLGYYLELAEFGIQVLAVGSALASLGLLALLLAARRGFADAARRVLRTRIGRAVLFFSVWLLLPLGIFLATQTFFHYCGYISVIPLSALLSLGIFCGARGFIQGIRSWGNGAQLGSTLPWGGVASVSVCLGLYLISFSPLFRTYGEWKDSGKILSDCLALISKVRLESPENCIVQIEDLPWGVAVYDDQIPHAKLVTYLQPYSIESWLELTQEGETEVVVHSMADLPTWPVTLSLAKKEGLGREVNVAFVAE